MRKVWTCFQPNRVSSPRSRRSSPPGAINASSSEPISQADLPGKSRVGGTRSRLMIASTANSVRVFEQIEGEFASPERLFREDVRRRFALGVDAPCLARKHSHGQRSHRMSRRARSLMNRHADATAARRAARAAGTATSDARYATVRGPVCGKKSRNAQRTDGDQQGPDRDKNGRPAELGPQLEDEGLERPRGLLAFTRRAVGRRSCSSARPRRCTLAQPPSKPGNDQADARPARAGRPGRSGRGGRSCCGSRRRP